MVEKCQRVDSHPSLRGMVPGNTAWWQEMARYQGVTTEVGVEQQRCRQTKDECSLGQLEWTQEEGSGGGTLLS